LGGVQLQVLRVWTFLLPLTVLPVTKMPQCLVAAPRGLSFLESNPAIALFLFSPRDLMAGASLPPTIQLTGFTTPCSEQECQLWG